MNKIYYSNSQILIALKHFNLRFNTLTYIACEVWYFIPLYCYGKI